MAATAGSPGRPQPVYEASKQEFAVPGLAAQSPWNQKSLAVKYPPLKQDIKADVAVIGAGIAGLSCAYNLAKAGKKVVVLEARTRGAGQTGRTTAHLMTWLDDYFYECESMHGKEKTRLVAESLRGAADWIERVVREEGIECKFRRMDGYLYPHATGESPQPTSAMAGLTNTEWVDLGGGPEVGGIRQCLRFAANADFHPLMYLEGLAAAVERHGGKIYEGTKAWKAGERALRTYAVGLLVRRDAVKRSLFWDTAEPYHYVRFDDWDDEHLLMIVGGEDHKTGSLWPYDPYDRQAGREGMHRVLEKYARSRWTAAGELLLKWNGQVMEPADLLYLHGHNPLVPDGNSYIITGDSGQGMTGGTIGGMVVSDLILGRKNPWADVYDPSRAPPLKSLLEIAEEGVITTTSYAERVLPKARPWQAARLLTPSQWLAAGVTLSYEMEPDSGAVVQKGVAVYCDGNKQQHAYSAVCPHLGCIIHWNSLEKTFDCPCHGSHFDRFGKCINGPAKGDLQPIPDCTSRGSQTQWPAAAARRPQPGRAADAAAAAAGQRGAAQLCRAVDPAGLQEVLVGGAVTAATAAALINGSSKGDPEVCASCAGTGGIKCFACEGSGKMLGVSREALAAAARQRDPLGGSRNQRECVACKGAGKIFCKNCSGSGFSRHM
ncbi:hypothetical protein CHLNCDRAFT_134365 [Chlorella variabilis]|uniref:Rieske domain-containing protein n=1 Tax=Chlorella variabilis TaxID=554065 RepID=E1ZFV2_CHLVA|nr:hypothetical protein CHLNCDRAFT_134365 [Chlorella variabilis]EFN55349.1 hypothetical protein CHLNCDRAFT_134365 [Chlorella variabilis]|eukprot:XP_005847451.1 hypothetical protein CHLNCDRAFT_134365 [Chlorella variabilis]